MKYYVKVGNTQFFIQIDWETYAELQEQATAEGMLLTMEKDMDGLIITGAMDIRLAEVNDV